MGRGLLDRGDVIPGRTARRCQLYWRCLSFLMRPRSARSFGNVIFCLLCSLCLAISLRSKWAIPLSVKSGCYLVSDSTSPSRGPYPSSLFLARAFAAALVRVMPR
jgi:hypothetical protein